MSVEPSSLGPYRLGDEVGHGALGRVVRAVDSRDGREVVLRVLKRALATDEVYLRRLEDQLLRASRVEHPRLAQPLEWSSVDDSYVIESLYVPGIPLAVQLEAEAQVPDEALRILLDVGAALAALHEHGVVHQGLSPEKVIVEEDGHATLTGAGLVTFGAFSMLTTRFDQVLGDVGYLAPEVIRGEPPGPPSDVYALGCLAFACLTGGPPFSSVFIYEVPLAHLEKEPPRLADAAPGADPSLGDLVARALSKEPKDRPTAERFVHDLTG